MSCCTTRDSRATAARARWAAARRSTPPEADAKLVDQRSGITIRPPDWVAQNTKSHASCGESAMWSASGQIWSNSPRLGPFQGSVWPNSLDFANDWGTEAGLDPNLVGLGQTIVDIDPILADNGPNLADIRPTLTESNPTSVQSGPNLAECGQHTPISMEHVPNAAQSKPTVNRAWPSLGSVLEKIRPASPEFAPAFRNGDCPKAGRARARSLKSQGVYDSGATWADLGPGRPESHQPLHPLHSGAWATHAETHSRLLRRAAGAPETCSSTCSPPGGPLDSREQFVGDSDAAVGRFRTTVNEFGQSLPGFGNFRRISNQIRANLVGCAAHAQCGPRPRQPTGRANRLPYNRGWRRSQATCCVNRDYRQNCLALESVVHPSEPQNQPKTMQCAQSLM